MKGLELAKAYYTQYGHSMIQEKFAPYASRITVGLCGEGSECFGFDDEISKDHDFGPAFCMWLDREIMDEIGERLIAEYEALPAFFEGMPAQREGRNLLTEKYVYMMRDTCPEEYRKIADRLPVLSEEKRMLVSELTELQTRWMERFHRLHPLFGGRGRAVRKTEAAPGDASVETYAMEELSTYSEKTLRCLKTCLEALEKQEEHPEALTMDYMARCYGYQSSDDAEQRLKQSLIQSM